MADNAKPSRKPIDWEAIEREYRAGQLSVREVARRGGITEGAIRKRAKAEGWDRALAEKVRAAVREKLVRADGTRDGTQPQRASDGEVIENASKRGADVVFSHRADLRQLNEIKGLLVSRLATVLSGGVPEGQCLGDRESPGDLLEKLSRVTSRLIPLERQAFSLDAGNSDPAQHDVSDRPLTEEEWAAEAGRNH